MLGAKWRQNNMHVHLRINSIMSTLYSNHKYNISLDDVIQPLLIGQACQRIYQKIDERQICKFQGGDRRSQISLQILRNDVDINAKILEGAGGKILSLQFYLAVIWQRVFRCYPRHNKTVKSQFGTLIDDDDSNIANFWLAQLILHSASKIMFISLSK